MTVLCCPFCGNDDVEYTDLLTNGASVQVECPECGAFGPLGDTVREATELWNDCRARENSHES